MCASTFTKWKFINVTLNPLVLAILLLLNTGKSLLTNSHARITYEVLNPHSLKFYISYPKLWSPSCIAIHHIYITIKMVKVWIRAAFGCERPSRMWVYTLYWTEYALLPSKLPFVYLSVFTERVGSVLYVNHIALLPWRNICNLSCPSQARHALT
jgi:hypothetical protein